MRHNKKFNHLGRTASHRNAMLANMACSLIKHKRITTTVAKAKALKKFVADSFYTCLICTFYAFKVCDYSITQKLMLLNFVPCISNLEAIRTNVCVASLTTIILTPSM